MEKEQAYNTNMIKILIQICNMIPSQFYIPINLRVFVVHGFMLYSCKFENRSEIDLIMHCIYKLQLTSTYQIIFWRKSVHIEKHQLVATHVQSYLHL